MLTASCFLGLRYTRPRIYERVQDHPNILRYLGQSPPECTLLRSALLFECHLRGSLTDCLGQLKNLPRGRWLYQAVSAFAYLHFPRVVHAASDLHNSLRDDSEIVLCELAGSGTDGGPLLLTGYGTATRHRECPSGQEDVFALGTVSDALKELEPQPSSALFQAFLGLGVVLAVFVSDMELAAAGR
ncbi:hypothetical protein BDY21DRAFT_424707 [Lineolata rhizophorae]|uniref:Protein kinase domain-containing protein n=1 Tax=Lineolata rhizophorae TaxID=578093 RepID=A0A6A6NN02_9PEZI|nr:hypothetical protein BDY21DRAFT_424707 [Lineolata rhizophorae]